MLTKLRADREALLATRATHEATQAAIVARSEAEAGRDLTPEEATSIREARAAKAEIDNQTAALNERIADLEDEEKRDAAAATLRASLPNGGSGNTAPAVVIAEARQYRDQGDHSFFVDSYRSSFSNDMRATERLQRHAREVEVEMEARATTTTSFAGLIVPQYLVDAVALVVRAGRPIADRCQSLPLPEQGTSFNIPRGTTGAAVAGQATQNTSVQSTDEVFSNLTLTVQTIAGQQDISRQSLERGTPGIDQIVYMDLAAAYAAELDRQVVVGSGTGELLGILSTASINAATAFGAAASASNFYLKLAGQVAAVNTNRLLPASAIYMHPRRFGWLCSQVDSSGRPLVVPVTSGPNNAQGVVTPAGYGTVVGYILGLPIVTDANIPTAVGSATGGEDQVIVLREADAWLWEDGDGSPRELRFEQTLGNQLTVKLVVYGYAAFTAGRYPKAVGSIGGLDTTTNGLVNPTF